MTNPPLHQTPEVKGRRSTCAVKSHFWKAAVAVGMSGVALLTGATSAGASTCNFIGPQGELVIVPVSECPEDPNYEPPATNPPTPPPNTTPHTGATGTTITSTTIPATTTTPIPTTTTEPTSTSAAPTTTSSSTTVQPTTTVEPAASSGGGTATGGIIAVVAALLGAIGTVIWIRARRSHD